MTEWSVLIETEGYPITPPQAIAITEALEHLAGVVTIGQHGTFQLGARVAIDGDLGDLTIATAYREVSAAASDAGVVLGPIVHAETTEWTRFEAELEQPNFPDLVGGAEAAAMLDVTKQRFHQLQQRHDFPQPAVRLAAGPVWLRSSIGAFAERWERKPGRPPTVVHVHASDSAQAVDSAAATVIPAEASRSGRTPAKSKVVRSATSGKMVSRRDTTTGKFAAKEPAKSKRR